MSSFPRLARTGHTSHCKICLSGLPFSQVEVDASRIAVIFYCLGAMDLLGTLSAKTSETDRQKWRDWFWEQQTSGKYGTGFKPSTYMTPQGGNDEYSDYDIPHLVMTYTALLSLAILRDDFSKLDRPGILRFMRACQREDGSFSALPDGGEADLRSVYCAFALSNMLDDWSGVDVDRAVSYIQRCSSYEGGYGQTPYHEALGGTTYCAVAALYLAPSTAHSSPETRMTPAERARTIRWLTQNQTSSGGFRGRTGKLADACYCFWCGATLTILGVGNLVDSTALAMFMAQCQYKFGGIAKAPSERPDPYHTYLSLASLALHPSREGDSSWDLSPLNVFWNITEETARWIKDHIPGYKA
ncbi:terpenoid cyclases/Protein prenyltransferase [Obba rivulosa]|uniref:Terpenoid cyclases/Protein prenyltransferase n=1 Tax=Obba rivulosa TaxID=1052685 RepID=A0A8E2B350_9APHY|nr:terpenoid cyclases/Protein prenyltransferase [Obba rivulosa]